MDNDLRERVARAFDAAGIDAEPWQVDAALAEMGAVRVKPLQWWEPSNDNNWTHGARTFFCTYYVGICGGRHNAWTEIFHEGTGQWDGPTRGRLEEAKADAQADYEARILAAIEPAPVSVREAAFTEAADRVEKIVWIEGTGSARDRDVFTRAIEMAAERLRAIAEGKDEATKDTNA